MMPHALVIGGSVGGLMHAELAIAGLDPAIQPARIQPARIK